MKKNKQAGQKDQSIKAILSLYRYNWLKYTSTATVVVIACIFEAFLPIISGYIIGNIVSLQENYSKLGFLLFAMVGSGVIHAIFWHLGDYMVVWNIVPSFHKYRRIIFDKAWDKDYSEYIQKPSGKIAASVNTIYQDYDNLYASFHYGFITLIVPYTVFIVYMFSTVWINGLILSGFLLIALLTLSLQLKNIREKGASHADYKAETDGKTYDSYSNFTNVISFRAHKKEFISDEKRINELLQRRKKGDYSVLNYWSTSSLLARGILWSVVLLVNFSMLKKGDISTSQFATAITVLFTFTSHFWELVHEVSAINTKMASYKQNYNYLFPGRNVVKEYYHEQKQKKVKIFKPSFNDSIKLNKLNFAYPDRLDNLVLRNINLDIRKNEKIGIVGKSGSGKSTLIKLLLGFYDYKEGSIQIDEKNVPKEELGIINSYVPQDTTLFQQSIAYNIAYAKGGRATKEEIIKAAKKAHAHEFIDSLPDKYETLVGERGIKLSLGQRQRIAIARAFLKESDLLILDEATSALDSKTEKLVQESLEDLWKGKTVIAIAHRLSTLNNVDRIIVMDKGKIVEQGTKAELLSLGGIFAELWNHQKDGLIIEDETEN
ncbi:MAG: ABC transporter ATP-binding protein [Candidatus Nomurabacteria bacterium]|nr:MAG: ABC transporter ATP-binding protein [Candidatus Nomurabacteria bacterium]HRV76026.1 ABC transporter ATP-binding protein [Candidatus Saccharimonadales bacterium]